MQGDSIFSIFSLKYCTRLLGELFPLSLINNKTRKLCHYALLHTVAALTNSFTQQRLVRLPRVMSPCVRLSGFDQAMTSTFTHGFQNNSAQLISWTRRSVIYNICSDRLKVKVTLESQVIKWSYIELVRAITSTFMHGFQNNLAQSFSLREITVRFETFVQVG